MERFPEALDGLPDAIVIVDADGRIRAGNGRVEPVLGNAPRELEGTDLERLLYDPDDGSAGEQLHRYVADPHGWSVSVADGGGARFEFRDVDAAETLD